MLFGDRVGITNFCRNWYLLWIPPVAKDKLFPLISTFADGYGPNNDPLKGYILIFFISLICVLIGDLNAVSALLSNFFVASYALMNFAVFHASITNTPGWRPSFKVRSFINFFPIIYCRLCCLKSKKYSALSYLYACFRILANKSRSNSARKFAALFKNLIRQVDDFWRYRVLNCLLNYLLVRTDLHEQDYGKLFSYIWYTELRRLVY